MAFNKLFVWISKQHDISEKLLELRMLTSFLGTMSHNRDNVPKLQYSYWTRKCHTKPHLKIVRQIMFLWWNGLKKRDLTHSKNPFTKHTINNCTAQIQKNKKQKTFKSVVCRTKKIYIITLNCTFQKRIFYRTVLCNLCRSNILRELVVSRILCFCFWNVFYPD